MVTIKDIAKEANVSVMTVSNVINKRTSKVSEETIKRVEEIIKKYNYIPNMNARSLVKDSSNLIPFIIFQNIQDGKKSIYNDPFISELLVGIDEVLKEKGYNLIVQSVNEIDEIVSLIKKWKTEGVIIFGMLADEVSILKEKIFVPVILIDTYIENKNEGVYTVGINDKLGGKLATNYLIENGHREIGFVSYEIFKGGIIEQRLLGYKEALKEHGLPFSENNIFSYDKEVRDPLKLAHKIILNKRLTGLVFSADLLAIQVMEHLIHNGVRIPEDLSIVGFDNILMSKYVSPKLTTIYQNIEQKGNEAAELLLTLLEKKNVEKSYIEIPIKLIIRNSVKKLKY